MKEINIDKKRLFVLLGVTIALIIGLALSKNLLSKKETPSFSKNYKVSIKVDATREDGTLEIHTIDVVNVKSGSKIRADFYQRPIYVSDERVIFDSGSKYKFYKTDDSIRSLDNIIGKIDLGDAIKTDGSERSYNPSISKETINSILKVLFIDKETSRSENAFVVIKDKTIKSLSLYLIGIEGYQDMNITMSFDEVNKKDEFEMPVFYEDVMEQIDSNTIKMIK